MLGAAGGIGQPMSLLLKQSPLITHLALYDIVNTPGETNRQDGVYIKVYWSKPRHLQFQNKKKYIGMVEQDCVTFFRIMIV